MQPRIPACLALTVLLTLMSACKLVFELPDWSGTAPVPEPAPEIITRPPPTSANATLAQLEGLELPQRDLADLAQRLLKVAEVPTIARRVPFDYQLGDEETFWASNADTNDHFEISAVLAYMTPHLFIWVEKGVQVDEEALNASADRFEEQTYPTNRSYFGSEWSPGVDSDIHLNVLHTRGLGSTVGGYFSPEDEFSQLAHPYSNEREMFYVNLDTIQVGDSYYEGLLAHEFQHMIHWYADRNEDLWLNEGLSVLAADLNGYDPGSFDQAFLSQPDVQLNDFDYQSQESSAHYGAGYLFALYFMERMGTQAMQALVAHPANGANGFDAVLASAGLPLDFEDLFADWAVALYLDAPDLGDGRYGFRSLDPGRPALAADHTDITSVTEEATVHQFAIDYISLTGSSPITLVFTGTRQARLVGSDPHGGTYHWWSNGGDDIDTTLTRAFDLSGLEAATLDYWIWYDIEQDWDYAYLEISTDGGLTWDTLPTNHTTDQNPTGNNYGHGYTGTSGGDTPEWIHEQVDISAYAGLSILIRFEYITDGAVHEAGLLVDDLRIDELGYATGFEQEDPTWQANGFVRNQNILPQEFIIQLIELDDKPRVRRLQLNSQEKARWTIPLGEEMSQAVLVVSGATPVTLERASYSYQLGAD